MSHQQVEYLSRRATLIAQERSLRFDFHKSTSIGDIELAADKVVRELRQHEIETIWHASHPEIDNLFPGMEFLTGKKLIQDTKLFRLLQKMPKGALLHAHLDATVDAAFVLQLALKQPSIHIRVPARVAPENLATVMPEFRPLVAPYPASSTSITDESYKSDSWVSLLKARDSFPLSLDGTAGFDKWVLGSMSIDPKEAYGTHNTPRKIWEKFTSTFLVSAGLLKYTPIFSAYVREFFKSAIEDGISYIEVRINFLYKYMFNDKGEETVPHREWLKIFDEAVKEVQALMHEQGRGDKFIGAKIIYTTIRFMSCEELEWYLEDCLALKQEYPHLIAGFDLVGDENKYHPLLYYVEPLLRFQQRQKELGLDIPFIFHAGETLGDGDSADHNLFDAILLGTKRIGHGFSLVKHPLLMELCKERGIAIEVCPISNEILRLTSSMPTHPLPILLNHGIHVVLCSDDPAVFGNMGLSYDFFQVLIASELTGLTSLGAIARQSLEHSTLEGEAKEHALRVWDGEWMRYLEAICHDSDK